MQPRVCAEPLPAALRLVPRGSAVPDEMGTVLRCEFDAPPLDSLPYDPASASLYVLVAQGQSEQLSLAAVDATGTVQSHARLHGDVGSSSEVLMAMAIR